MENKKEKISNEQGYGKKQEEKYENEKDREFVLRNRKKTMSNNNNNNWGKKINNEEIEKQRNTSIDMIEKTKELLISIYFLFDEFIAISTDRYSYTYFSSKEFHVNILFTKRSFNLLRERKTEELTDRFGKLWNVIGIVK